MPNQHFKGVGISPRRQAEFDGALTYFTGKPCKWGHVARRATISGTCGECARAYEMRKRRFQTQSGKSSAGLSRESP